MRQVKKKGIEDHGGSWAMQFLVQIALTIRISRVLNKSG
jgi:hypothetical protein